MSLGNYTLEWTFGLLHLQGGQRSGSATQQQPWGWVGICVSHTSCCWITAVLIHVYIVSTFPLYVTLTELLTLVRELKITLAITVEIDLWAWLIVKRGRITLKNNKEMILQPFVFIFFLFPQHRLTSLQVISNLWWGLAVLSGQIPTFSNTTPTHCKSILSANSKGCERQQYKQDRVFDHQLNFSRYAAAQAGKFLTTV